MKIILAILFTFCFACAEGQTSTIKVKKKENKYICDCKEAIAIDLKGSSIDTLSKIKNGGFLQGQIFDQSTELPISNAVVELIFDSKIIAACCTDSLGNYKMRSVLPNKYILRSKKCGYQTKNKVSTEIKASLAVYQNLYLIPDLEKKKP